MASATIVTPVGTESVGEKASPTTSVTHLIEPARLNVVPKNPFGEESLFKNERQTKELASIKLWDNNFSFRILPIERPKLVGSTLDGELAINAIDAKSTKISDVNTSLISVAAVFALKKTQSAGFYLGDKPFQVIITFE
jgi:hypothetical protein